MKLQILFEGTLIRPGPRGVLAISAEDWRYQTPVMLRTGNRCELSLLYGQFCATAGGSGTNAPQGRL
jgi:hypothetical protein